MFLSCAKLSYTDILYLFQAAYGLSLDGSVTSSFLPFATSAFKKHLRSEPSLYVSRGYLTRLN